MIYGTPTIHRDDDQTDRIGIRTLVLSQLWQPSRWPLSQEELDAESPAPPEVSAGVVFIGQQTRRQGGALRTVWSFEGINGNGKSVTFKQRHNSIDYRFDPGFSEKSLLLLPNIQELFDTYGGYVLDGQIYWPPLTPEQTGSANKKSATAGKPNPMFGRDSKRMMDGTYSFRYAEIGYGKAFADVGKIFTTGKLPGKPPTDIGDRNWLKATPGVIRRGPVHDITETYLLSEEGGHPEAIYGTAGKDGDGGSRVDLTDGEQLAVGRDAAPPVTSLTTGGL